MSNSRPWRFGCRNRCSDVSDDHDKHIEKGPRRNLGALFRFAATVSAPKVAATSAVKALITVKQSLGALNSERRDQGFQAVEIASAIHTGPAVIGAIGNERRLEFTAIGDTINICSRLEGLAKDQGETCVASKAIVELCPDAPFKAMGDFSLRGSSQQISTYALTLDG